MGRSLPSLSVGSGPRAGITGYKISSPSFSLSCSLSLPVFASHIVLVLSRGVCAASCLRFGQRGYEISSCSVLFFSPQSK